MKRPAILVVFALFAAAAMAQIHGVPASVSSQTSRNSAPGVPASVTSLGPRGYSGYAGRHGTATYGWQQGGYQSGWQRGAPFGTPPALPPTTVSCFGGGLVCAPTTVPSNNGFNGRHHHDKFGYGNGYGYGYGGYPYGGGYIYAPYLYSDTSAYSPDAGNMGASYDYTQPSSTVTVEPDPPAPTIYERRPTTRPYARDEARYDNDYRGPAAEAAPKQASAPVSEQDPTTLVFADGHQMDVHNYAIVGQTLFNLDGTGPFRVKLAELNLDATEKINEDHGVEFSLPK